MNYVICSLCRPYNFSQLIHIKCYKIRLFNFFITKRDVLNTSPNNNVHAFCYYFFNPKYKGYESTCYFSHKCTVLLSKASQCQCCHVWPTYYYINLNKLWHWSAQHLSLPLPKHCAQLRIFFTTTFIDNSSFVSHIFLDNIVAKSSNSA